MDRLTKITLYGLGVVFGTPFVLSLLKHTKIELAISVSFMWGVFVILNSIWVHRQQIKIKKERDKNNSGD